MVRMDGEERVQRHLWVQRHQRTIGILWLEWVVWMVGTVWARWRRRIGLLGMERMVWMERAGWSRGDQRVLGMVRMDGKERVLRDERL
jgi:hypothetical protein